MAAAGPRLVLTGPSGWIGQAMLAEFATRLGGRLDGRVTAFASHARAVVLPWGETLQVRALSDLAPADIADAHVFHLAYLTKDKADLLGERAFARTNHAIDAALLSAMAAARPRSLFVASSGAAALAADGRDLHPYGLAKLRQEDGFLAAAERLGVPTLVGRVFNLAGPYINKLGSYAISNMIAQARGTERIVIDARVPVFRSYLHVADLCALAYRTALAGIDFARPVDLCGAQIVEMADVATEVARALDTPIEIVRGPIDWQAPSIYLGDFTHTRVLAMRLDETLAGFARQVDDTARWMNEVIDNKKSFVCESTG